MSNFPNGYANILKVYGNPNKGGQLNKEWYDENIVRMALPSGMVMKLAWDTNKKVISIPVHKKVKDSLFNVLQEIWNTIRLDVKAKYPDKATDFYDQKCRERMSELHLDLYGGTFNFRVIRGRAALSTHAFGISIDIDPEGNPLGATKGRIPIWVVNIFKNHGWTWGGDFKSRKDWQHFQACSGY